MTIYSVLNLWIIFGIGYEWSWSYITTRAIAFFAGYVGLLLIARNTQRISDLGSQFADENTWITPLWSWVIASFIFWFNLFSPPTPNFDLTFTKEAIEFIRRSPPQEPAATIAQRAFWGWTCFILFVFSFGFTPWALSDDWQNLRRTARSKVERLFGAVAGTATAAAGALAPSGTARPLTFQDAFRIEVWVSFLFEGLSYLLNVLLHR